MKTLVEFPAAPLPSKPTTTMVQESPESEPADHDPVPLDPEFLAWLQELL
jgi:hypothetical protein